MESGESIGIEWSRAEQSGVDRRGIERIKVEYGDECNRVELKRQS
jgi:hypothetical protein